MLQMHSNTSQTHNLRRCMINVPFLDWGGLLGSTSSPVRSILNSTAYFCFTVSKSLRSRPHIQFMNPQITFLLAQPQIRLAHALRLHPRASPHLLPICAFNAVGDTAIRDRVNDMQPSRRVLSRQTLCQHPHSSPSSTIRRILRIRPHCAERASEDQRPLFLHRRSFRSGSGRSGRSGGGLAL